MHGYSVVALIFLLILAYLFLNNSSATVAVLNSLGTNVTSLTSTLQGKAGTTLG